MKLISCFPNPFFLFPVRVFFLFSSFLLILFSHFSSARTETLEEALVHTYFTNPYLRLQEARLGVTNEGLPKALSGLRPNISIRARTNRSSNFLQDSGIASSLNLEFVLSQTIFDGFRTSNASESAEFSILAARELLKNVEQEVLFGAVEAYTGVVRDRAILRLRQEDLNFLKESLRATRDRFAVGFVTSTDIAEAEAGVALASAQLSRAEALLAVSEAVYQEAVGYPPGELSEAEAPLYLLPKSLDSAIEYAHKYHPKIVSAIYQERAARSNVFVKKGALYPRFSVEASLGLHHSFNDEEKGAIGEGRIMGVFNIPIYQSGSKLSSVRKSEHIEMQREFEIEIARRNIQVKVISAWGKYKSALVRIVSRYAEIKAVRTALNGIQKEFDVGQRNTLDVLDAQRNLVDAEVNYVTARRDRLVASYELLAATGQLKVKRLNLPFDQFVPKAQ
ncbi:MAG: TolC family outer membrane protein [Alphaproteobacteria bacterium]|nr:TolC family outer membrane protein [Alphaproteobacteria bacterium]